MGKATNGFTDSSLNHTAVQDYLVLCRAHGSLENSLSFLQPCVNFHIRKKPPYGSSSV